MANGDTQDERAMDEPTLEELRAAEIAKTQQALALVNAAKQEEASLTPRNRMYIGPNVGGGELSPRQFFQDAPTNLLINRMTPPPTDTGVAGRLQALTAPESDASSLARLQAADQPGSRTIGVNSEPPYSDASLSNQRNMMLYNTMKKFDAGDRSPEVMAAVLGKSASSKAPAIPSLRNVSGIGYAFNPATGKWESQTPTPTPKPRGVPAGLINTHNALIAQWLNAFDGDQKKAYKSELDAFVKQYPEVIGGTSTAATVTRTAPPAAAIQAPAKAAAGAPPKVTSQAQFDALPKGAIYMGTDGKRKKKP